MFLVFVLIILHIYIFKIREQVRPEFQECVKSHVNKLSRNSSININLTLVNIRYILIYCFTRYIRYYLQ